MTQSNCSCQTNQNCICFTANQCGCNSTTCKCQQKSKQTDQIEDELVCEGCADHVCNDNCGCELSEAAKASLARDLERKK